MISSVFPLKELHGSEFILSISTMKAAVEMNVNVCGCIYMQQYAFECLHLNAKI